jgi:hypothetical protein
MISAPRALLVALFAFAVVFISRVASADESPRWDTSSLWIGPEWKLGGSMHHTTLARDIDICHPYSKQCTHVATVPRSALDGNQVDSGAVDFGANFVGIGPLRLGMEMSLGLGDGPSTRTHVVPAVVDGWVFSEGAVDLGLRFRGDRWAAFVELTGGFITLNANVAGIKDADSLVANGGGYFAGGRVGGGVLITEWLSASAYAGGAAGQVSDVSLGLRLELRMDPLFNREHH